MPLRAPIAVLLAAALLGGCTAQGGGGDDDSSGDFTGEARAVATAIEDFESAASESDEGEICRDLLTRDLVTKLARGGSCERTVNATIEDTDTFGLSVERVNVTGTTATARVKADRGDRDEITSFTLAKVGRGWRIAGFGS